MSSVRVQVGAYSVQLWREEWPSHLDVLMQAADLAERYGDLRGRNDEDGELFAVSISQNGVGSLSSLLTVAQRFSPETPGFEPGVLIVPETSVAFIGAGERLLAYDLKRAVRLWEDTADAGFWWWDRAGDVVLMAAELELAAWTTTGTRLWSMFVEPPWSYWLEGDQLNLNVMNVEQTFLVKQGPILKPPAGSSK
ncbi:hypothetical protein [Deinococcus sp.]|uniref:hypothetical protein n=1 Tax=Deinococcus sp. TaxID=47478 RepID=UPI0025FA262E|nr:hypothetical protein [Deinococcus sp.]